VTVLQTWKESKCYTVVTIQNMKMKFLENKVFEKATQNTIVKVALKIINSNIRRFYWPSSPTRSNTGKR